MSQGRFNLRKWYLDCVTDWGDATIVYCAELKWRGLTVRYSSLLLSRGGSTATRTSVAKFILPLEKDGVITLSLPRFGLTGQWSQLSSSVRRTVFESEDGTVTWDCSQPKANARIEIADAGQLIGLGYAECLTLTMPPWKLPLRDLRWGRYLSEQDSIVWMDWQGPFTTRFAYHNGREAAITTISDSEIVLDGFGLNLDRGFTLRSGFLGDTVVSGAPVLRDILPRSLFAINEHKWRSRAEFTPKTAGASGWAIHEVVHWNT